MFKLYHICCLTMSLYMIPIVYYYKIERHKCPYYNMVLFLSICCITCSNLFWINPIQHNFYHKIDSIFAKMSYFYIVPYTFLIHLPTKKKSLFYEYCIINLFILLFFSLSSYFSSRKWCSNKHIISHILFHLFGLYSYFYTHC